jgi:hypothetical protein
VDTAWDELRAVYARGELVVFAGSGISRAAGLPSWARLAEVLADLPRMRQDTVRREEMLAYVQARKLVDALSVAEEVLGRPELGIFVERMLNDQDVQVPDLARAIAALAPGLKAVLTTNLDHLLERAFEGRWPPLWRTPGNIQRKRYILKLYGTLFERSSWVFTRRDHDEATWGHGNLREVLSLFFRSFPLLFVGHELEDDALETVLAQVRALAGDQPPRHFALVPQGSLLGARRKGLEQAGIRLIEYADADGKQTNARRLLEDLAGVAAMEKDREPPATSETASTSGTSSERVSASASDRCPFPGLEVFDEDMAELFFGRETETGEALQALGDGEKGHVRWLQVEGASGTGKSSFCRAGLVPKVRLGWIGGAPQAWCVATLRPGPQPLLSLAHVVFSALKPSGVSLEGFRQELRQSETALASFLRQHVPPAQGFLLLVDQLEELFTLADPAGVRMFDRVVASALEDSGGPLYLVTTLRSDFLGRMETLPELGRLLRERASRYSLGPMKPLSLRAAIMQPAERVGLRWEAGLPERLLEDVAGHESALPLLSHALRQLWGNRSVNTLTHAAYDGLGGATGALTRSADHLLSGLGKEAGLRAKSLLLALVTLQGGRVSRRSLSRREVLEAAGGEGKAEELLTRLSGGRDPMQPETAPAPVRLVLVTQKEGEDRVDLVHEALLTRWVTLSEWLKEERQALDRREDLEAAARAWRGAGYPRRELPTGAQLAYLRTASPVTSTAREFLKRSEDREKIRTRKVAAAFTALAVGLLVMFFVAQYAFAQRTLAEQRLEDAIAVADRIIFGIDRKLEPIEGAAEVRRELLESASKLLDKLHAGDSSNPEVLRSRMVAHNQQGDLEPILKLKLFRCLESRSGRPQCATTPRCGRQPRSAEI